MHYHMLILYCFLSTYAYSKSLTKPKKEEIQTVRCEQNGPSELTPYLTQLKSKKFKDVQLTKTKERAYSLIERARLIKNNQEFTYTQAGCDHMSEEVSFVTKESQALSDLQAHLSHILVVLDAIEVEQMQKSVKNLVKDLNAKNTQVSEKNYQCEDASDT